MIAPDTSSPRPPHPGIGFREFVALIAALMAINALGIDSMLPALPAIGDALGITEHNHRQWIIAAYVFGFGGAQIVYGPLADRLGRKPVLLVTMALFALTSVVAAFADSFETMIAARILQGITAASSRVLTVSIVRDCYSGRQMARVMSLSFMVFLAVPILAPSIGQLILLVAPWPWIFIFLAGFGAALSIWAWLRLPETLSPEDRRAIRPREIIEAARLTLGNRTSIAYTLGSTALFGGLLGFINSAQQIFVDTFDAIRLFSLIFAGIAGFMVVSSFVNSRIVERLGPRIVSHGALVGFIAISAIHVAVVASGYEYLWSYAVFQAATMFCFGLIGSNFGAMAMEPVGHIAGTAASIQGFISTVGGALIGIIIGQSFDGSTLPVAAGFLVVGLAALVCAFIAERGRLFCPTSRLQSSSR